MSEKNELERVLPEFRSAIQQRQFAKLVVYWSAYNAILNGAIKGQDRDATIAYLCGDYIGDRVSNHLHIPLEILKKEKVIEKKNYQSLKNWYLGYVNG